MLCSGCTQYGQSCVCMFQRSETKLSCYNLERLVHFKHHYGHIRLLNLSQFSELLPHHLPRENLELEMQSITPECEVCILFSRMKLPYTQSNHWSIEDIHVYSNCSQGIRLSRQYHFRLTNGLPLYKAASYVRREHMLGM